MIGIQPSNWQQLVLAAFISSLSLISIAVAQTVAAGKNGDYIKAKDLGKLQGWRDNALIGYGVVSGLAGTGDSSSNRTTRQTIANVLSQFNMTISPEQVQSRNMAVVMVTASLPPFAREGDALDVTVTSAGDARSLVGGSLIMTPLKAANGRTYALAQGPLAVGGYRYDANGNVIQKNHPTVGSVPGGATVEVGMLPAIKPEVSEITFVLNEPDYTTANRIAVAINAQIAPGTAAASDPAGVLIHIPENDRDRLVPFLARVEAVLVEPDRRAKVVINERTGTVVFGGDVRISKIAVSHGDIRVSIATDNSVSQPLTVGRASESIRTVNVANSRVEVDEGSATGYVTASNTVGDLVQSLARLKTNTRDIISILRAVKAAGALHAELVIQ